MRVAIAGAGNVGQSIARALLTSERNRVLIIERQWEHYRPQLVPAADWLYADACEYAALQDAGIETADAVIAATGDDKVNLVFALLAKTQFQVPRVVARVNDPGNHWLFGDQWGVDVAVSTPVRLAAAVDEAVVSGHLVRLMNLQQSGGSIVEYTVPTDGRLAGMPLAPLALPPGAVLLGVYRSGELALPAAVPTLAAGDELVLLIAGDAEAELRAQLRG
jgi:trk system potassium uptake protein TrkA